MMCRQSRRLSILSILVCGLAGVQGAHAADTKSSGTVYSLSPEEKAEIEAEGLEREMHASGLAGEDSERRIHGEASMMVGTGGARGVATSVVAPVGKSATVGASFVYERNRYDYDPYGYYAPSGIERHSFGASDRFGHLERVERMERYRDWRAGRP
ncbi:MAG TPA: hypothetical protein VIG90_00870 [Pedomonas sp.]|uniref:hypothetical protein n=1 Tax=Pedomonas sp. TaxID=2976421 RepID=UPI002F405E0F